MGPHLFVSDPGNSVVQGLLEQTKKRKFSQIFFQGSSSELNLWSNDGAGSTLFYSFPIF